MNNNKSMESPSEKSEEKLSAILAGLEKTAKDMDSLRYAIGSMRDQLNKTTSLLCRLKDVIGKDAHAYNYNKPETWHELIDACVKDAVNVRERCS